MSERADTLQWWVAKASQSVKSCHGLNMRSAASEGCDAA